MKNARNIVVALATCLCLGTAGCMEDCDTAAKDACIQDCHARYTHLSEILLHNECVYDCTVSAGCDPGCLGQCYHDMCTRARDVLSYAHCQNGCKAQCGE